MKTIVKENVNIGIKIMLAIRDITFKVLKKYAMINTSEIIVAILIERLSKIHLGIFNLFNAERIDLLRIQIPITHAKLIKNPASKADKGFIK